MDHATEQELRNRAERFETIFNLAPLGIAEGAWGDDEFLLVNRHYAKMLGYSTEELMKLTFRDFTHPDDLDQDVGLFAQLQAGEITHYTLEKRYIRKDGKIIWVELTVSALKFASPQPQRCLAVFHDITARKVSELALQQREEHFRRLIENGSDLVLEIDAAKRISFVSPSLQRLLGVDPPAWIGTAAVSHVTPEDHDAFNRMLDETHGHPGQSVEARFRAMDRAGNLRLFESRARSLDTPEGPITILNARDITDAVELEERLRQSQKMEAIGTLAGGIAHDFNNILTAISAYNELIRGTAESSSPIARYSESVGQATNRAKHLVQQILTTSRKQESAQTRVELRPILEEAVAFLQAMLPAAVHIHTELLREPTVVLANATQLQQILLNLGTNTYHALGSKPGRITLTLTHAAITVSEAKSLEVAPGDFARIEMSDNGPGIPPEIQDRIFEPFFTTKGPGQGTGLGLSVAHGIMRSHRGSIHLIAPDRPGTTFEILLPLAANQTPATPPRQRRLQMGSGERILVLDDEPTIAESLSLLLRKLNFDVTTFTSGTAAIAAVQAHPQAFDLILTDYSMPKVLGTAVADAIHAFRPDLPVILSSGYAGALPADGSHRKSIVEILNKPVPLEELVQAIKRHVATQPSTPLT